MGNSLKRLHRNAFGKPLEWIGIDKQTYAAADPLGQATGAWDKLYQPEKIEPIPSPATATTSAFEQRDNVRRLARRAAGRDSTVRTGPGGAPYSAQPKTLLGS